LTTVSISGANFLIVVSTPALSVIWFTLQLVHAPSRRTFTCLLSSIEISLISPPSEFKKGLISSRAFKTLFVISSVVISLILDFFDYLDFLNCNRNLRIFIIYFFTAEHPAIVVIFTASVGGKHHFNGTTLMQQLLENEGIKVVENQIIDFENHFWQPEICK